MNEKVTQMVSLLFKEIAPSEEVRMLQEEVLNNCQDGFMDLTASGLGEDEALAAVMESLKGMEDVLKDYPRKSEEEPSAVEEEAEEAEDKMKAPAVFRFNPGDIHAVDAQLTFCDIEVLASEEGCSLEVPGDVRMELDPEGTLCLRQENVSGSLFKGISWDRSLDSFDHFGDALSQLGKNLTNLFTRGLNPEEEDCRVVLRLSADQHPEIRVRTTSGDITWEDPVPGKEFSLISTSGNIQVDIAREFLLPHVRVSTMSGDMSLRLSAAEASFTTVSGDVSWEGDADILEIKSTSGDVDAVGSVRSIRMSTTSGDLSLELQEAQEAEIQASAISGDIDLKVPQSVREVAANLKSISGDVRCRGVDLVEEAQVRVNANTVSGDLKIH